MILKNKERLLSFEEPTRFIFSHSALREGWDNPNVFQICTLKHSDSNTAKRQEVGRGLRLCVNQGGNRMDIQALGESIHDINTLTVVASESYKTFVTDLQSDIKTVLYDRPTEATSEYFKGKYVKVDGEPTLIDDKTANDIEFYLIQNGYVDMDRKVTDKYREDIKNGTVADLPEKLKPMAEGIHMLIQSVYDDSVLKDMFSDGHESNAKDNPLNENFAKKEFQALWREINHKYAYTVEFDSDELIKKSIEHINDKLFISELQYTTTIGRQKSEINEYELSRGDSFVRESSGTYTLKHAEVSVGGGIFRELINLTPTNHHFKSLGHNPTLLGLFFSILDQFTNTSDFVSNGELISLNNSEGKFELQGKNIPSKLFCGIVNWIGHLISDVSGSSSSKGRGMGLPSPIWAWSNDVIAIKRKLNIPLNEFDKSVNELALKLFEKGYDVRFQTTQTIPVFINEIVVRMLYSIRRLIKYYITVPSEDRCWGELWKSCEPFSNATVKRMLTVAHGTFCLTDIVDATIKGVEKGASSFNVVEFFMRLNIIGVGRFTISLYGEAERGIQRSKAKKEVVFLKREKLIVDDYIEGLKILSKVYDDKVLLTFVSDFQSSDLYKEAFNKSVELAKLRNVPEKERLNSKLAIDTYFRGEH